MSTVCLARLGSRALDGAFAAPEIPALLVRLALYGHSGELELTQAGDVRRLAFAQGRLVGAASTAESGLGLVAPAHASQIIDACLSGGDAIAWFERREVPSGDELHLFAAVWEAVRRHYAFSALVALGREFFAAGVQVNEAAAPYLRSVAANPGLVELAAQPRGSSDAELATIGALGLCGLVGGRGGTVALDG